MADTFPGATVQQSKGFYVRTGIDPQLVVSVIHTTAGLGSAATIAKVVEPKQVTATFWTNRDGTVVQAMGDPLRMAPWTNGFLNRPDVTNPRIARMVKDRVNPNQRSLVTIENVSREPGAPITAAQEKVCADIIRYYHTKHGVPITRETVVGHYQFDSVNRPNCPSVNKAVIDRIVAMAAQGGDVNLKGTLIEWINNRTTTITNQTGAGFTEDPTAQPYNNLAVLVMNTAFTPSVKVRANQLAGTDEWYGGWVALDPPQFGYIILTACGPLTVIEAGDEAASAKAVADAAAAEAAKFQ